jgi:hypothetical protein
MHWYVDFKDPVDNPEREPTLFAWGGGLPALARMTRIFWMTRIQAAPPFRCVLVVG